MLILPNRLSAVILFLEYNTSFLFNVPSLCVELEQAGNNNCLISMAATVGYCRKLLLLKL